MYLSIYYARENRRRDAAEAEAGHESSLGVDEDEKVGREREMVEVPTNLHHKAPGFRFYT